MEKIFFSNINKIKKVKDKVEKELNVKIEINKEVSISGEGFSEYIAITVLGAVDIGFDINTALILSDQDYMLEKINIKSHVKQSRLPAVRGRLIGREGKVKKRLEQLTNCSIVVKDNTIALIGKTEDVIIARKAIHAIIRGSPHSRVFTSLEKSRKETKLKQLKKKI